MIPEFLVGGYTSSMNGNAEGIGALVRSGPDDSLTYSGPIATTSSPSFLALGVVPGLVYAANEGEGRVEAFSLGDDGGLRHLGGQPTAGSLPCHLTVTATWLYVANYGSGDIDVFPLERDGTIAPLHQSIPSTGSGPHPAQDGPHAHSTLVIDDLVLSANLGTDAVDVHQWRAGQLTKVRSLAIPAGSGPRDFARTPDGRVWLLGELSGEIFALDGLDTDEPHIAASGQAAVSPVAGDHAAGLAVGDDGRFLYTGLRGSNRIAVFDTYAFAAVIDVGCGGDWPRHLTIDDGVLHVACERSSTVTAFAIDAATGVPRQVETAIPAPTPTYLLAPGT